MPVYQAGYYIIHVLGSPPAATAISPIYSLFSNLILFIKGMLSTLQSYLSALLYGHKLADEKRRSKLLIRFLLKQSTHLRAPDVLSFAAACFLCRGIFHTLPLQLERLLCVEAWKVEHIHMHMHVQVRGMLHCGTTCFATVPRTTKLRASLQRQQGMCF